MNQFKLLTSIIILSSLLAGCGGGSSSSTGNVTSGNTEAGGTDTGGTDTGGTDTGGTDTGGTDTSTSEPTAAEPEVRTTNYTYSRVFGGQAVTINATITETHQNDPDLTTYRVWNYRNPAIIRNGSEDSKVYLYDKYDDHGEGFERSSFTDKATYTYSNLSTVDSNQFLKVTTETMSYEKTELSGVIHDKIDSQTFSEDSELIAEELLHIVEDISYRNPCDETRTSLGEMGRYRSSGFWQPGDKLVIDLEIYSPAFQCVDGVANYLGHVTIQTTSTSELVGTMNQISLQGRSFNSVLRYVTSEKSVSQDTGNTITDNHASYYYQLHTGLVASEGTRCLVGGNGTNYCVDENEVASNLPTIPVLN